MKAQYTFAFCHDGQNIIDPEFDDHTDYLLGCRMEVDAGRGIEAATVAACQQRGYSYGYRASVAEYARIKSKQDEAVAFLAAERLVTQERREAQERETALLELSRRARRAAAEEAAKAAWRIMDMTIAAAAREEREAKLRQRQELYALWRKAEDLWERAMRRPLTREQVLRGDVTWQQEEMTMCAYDIPGWGYQVLPVV